MRPLTLRCELFFRPDPSPEHWRDILRTIWTWEPRLAPRGVERLSDADAEGKREPWSDARFEELARRCAVDSIVSWSLFGEQSALLVAREPAAVRLSAIAQAHEEPSAWLSRLLTSLERTPPALAMVFDPDSKQDAPLIMQSLDRLADVPPVFYLDPRAAATLGGATRLRNAPADVRQVASGLLFNVRSVTSRPSSEERQRTTAMRQFLGLSAQTALSLAGEEHRASPPGEPAWNLVQWWAQGVEGWLGAAWSAAADEAWAVGESGVIVRWDGDDWSAVDSGSSRSLTSISGTDGDAVWAVGEAGTILRWNGSQWSGVAGPTEHQLHGVWGSTRDHAFAVGDAGTLIRWNGRAWSRVDGPSTRSLFAVSGSGEAAAWAVGEAGTILRWDGARWSQIESPARVSLFGVSALGSGEAWAVGAEGCVLRASGGVWTRVTSGTESNLRAVFARSADDVWVGGDNCTLRHWDGRRWTQVESDTRETLMGLCTADDASVWVVGGKAAIFMVTPGA